MKIYFITSNALKIAEAQDAFAYYVGADPQLGVDMRQVNEPLNPNMELIVKQKTLDAYKAIRVPCVVQHGGLYLAAWGGAMEVGTNPDQWGGLLGAFGGEVWKAVGEKMCGFLRAGESRAAIARSMIGYCDGKKISVHVGETRGSVTEEKRGANQLHWDPIFVPEGENRTHAEMNVAEKRATSPTAKAWRAFLSKEFPSAFKQKEKEHLARPATQ